jgi:hypothetical protein
MKRTENITRAAKEARLTNMSLFDGVDMEVNPLTQGSSRTSQAEPSLLNSMHRLETVTEIETEIESVVSRNHERGPVQPFGTGAASDSVPSAAVQDGYVAAQVPERRLVRIGLIDFHPLLQRLYSQRGTQFPPEVTPGHLTLRGIQATARFLPIHLVTSGARMQCFAGMRLWLAAQNTLGPDAEIEALVYSHIDGDQVAEAMEMELDILCIWHRQSEKERLTLEMSYMTSSSPNGLRENFDGTEQEKWRKILKTSLKTLQNRLASRRRKA